MPLLVDRVYLVECDRCHRPLPNTGGLSYSLTFSSAEAALNAAGEKAWTIRTDEVLCPVCKGLHPAA